MLSSSEVPENASQSALASVTKVLRNWTSTKSKKKVAGPELNLVNRIVPGDVDPEVLVGSEGLEPFL